MEKIWGTVARGRRSSPLSRDIGLTVPKVPRKRLFYYPIVLNHQNTVNSSPTLIVHIENWCFPTTFKRFHSSRDQSTVFVVACLPKSCKVMVHQSKIYRALGNNIDSVMKEQLALLRILHLHPENMNCIYIQKTWIANSKTRILR